MTPVIFGVDIHRFKGGQHIGPEGHGRRAIGVSQHGVRSIKGEGAGIPIHGGQVLGPVGETVAGKRRFEDPVPDRQKAFQRRFRRRNSQQRARLILQKTGQGAGKIVRLEHHRGGVDQGHAIIGLTLQKGFKISAHHVPDRGVIIGQGGIAQESRVCARLVSKSGDLG